MLSREIADTFTVLALLLTIPALVFAWITILDCKRLVRQLGELADTEKVQAQHSQEQTKRLDGVSRALEAQESRANELAERLDAVGKALTTQYISSFPKYLPYVAKLIEKSEKDLRIMCAMYGHGTFTDPAGWDKVEAALKDATVQRRINPRVLATTKEFRTQLFKWQYPAIDRDWSTIIREKGALYELIQNFIPKGRSLDLMTKEDFFQVNLEDEDEIKHRVFRRADILENDRMLPLYVWVADETEAIFAFPTHSESDRSSDVRGDASFARAFLTKDKDIVQALIQVFERLFGEASDRANKVAESARGTDTAAQL